jgi:hypothetical protein
MDSSAMADTFPKSEFPSALHSGARGGEHYDLDAGANQESHQGDALLHIILEIFCGLG